MTVNACINLISETLDQARDKTKATYLKIVERMRDQLGADKHLWPQLQMLQEEMSNKDGAWFNEHANMYEAFSLLTAIQREMFEKVCGTRAHHGVNA